MRKHLHLIISVAAQDWDKQFHVAPGVRLHTVATLRCQAGCDGDKLTAICKGKLRLIRRGKKEKKKKENPQQFKELTDGIHFQVAFKAKGFIYGQP